MRVLFDVAHPAHVRFFAPIARQLQASGAEVRVAGRDKDLTVPLLAVSGLPYEVVSRAAQRRSRPADARELSGRVRAIRRIVTAWRPDVLLSRNPSGVLAGRGTPTRTVFDTDDGRSAGLHYRLAAPHADVVTSSVHDPEDHGRGHVRYGALKAHAYLHPDRFRPDPAARREVGLELDEPLHVVRWSRHDASHDAGIAGMTPQGREDVVALLRAHGPVLVSAECDAPRLLTAAGTRSVAPSRFVDLLATASTCVTDGQSVAAEAALLGVPALRLSGFTGRVWYLGFLERQGLLRNFSPGEEDRLLGELEALLADVEHARTSSRRRADALNAGSIDLAEWFAGFVTELATTDRSGGDPVHARDDVTAASGAFEGSDAA